MTAADAYHRVSDAVDAWHERSMQLISWIVSAVALLAGLALALLPPAIAHAPTFRYAFGVAHPVAWAALLGAFAIWFALAVHWKPTAAYVPGFALCGATTLLSVLILLSIPSSHIPLTGVLLVGYGAISGVCALYYSRRH